MKNAVVYAALCSFALFFSGCSSHRLAKERSIANAHATSLKFAEAFSKADLDGIMETYWHSPEVVLYPPGEREVRGWDNIKESYRALFTQMKGAHLEITESNYQALGDAVAVWGLWKISFPTCDCHCKPKVPDMVGRFSEVHAVRDGKLVMISDHASVPMPPATCSAKNLKSKKLVKKNQKNTKKGK